MISFRWLSSLCIHCKHCPFFWNLKYFHFATTFTVSCHPGISHYGSILSIYPGIDSFFDFIDFRSNNFLGFYKKLIFIIVWFFELYSWNNCAKYHRSWHNNAFHNIKRPKHYGKSRTKKIDEKKFKIFSVNLYNIRKTLLSIHKKCNFLICRCSRTGNILLT